MALTSMPREESMTVPCRLHVYEVMRTWSNYCSKKARTSMHREDGTGLLYKPRQLMATVGLSSCSCEREQMLMLWEGIMAMLCKPHHTLRMKVSFVCCYRLGRMSI